MKQYLIKDLADILKCSKQAILWHVHKKHIKAEARLMGSQPVWVIKEDQAVKLVWILFLNSGKGRKKCGGKKQID